MELVEDIIKLMKLSSSDDIALITKAFNFAKESHRGQKRFSGESYFSHSFSVAKILADFGMGPTVVSAGFLHDVLEDTPTTEDEIRAEFGDEMLFLVNGVTKIGKLKYRGVKRYNESLKKLFIAVSQDNRVIIIRLADRLHNMRTLRYIPENKQVRIATETLEIYISIAYRLGIRWFNRELEDLAFPFVYPIEYKKTKNLLNTKMKEDFYKLDNFQKSIKKQLVKKDIINFKVEYRIKTLYSLYKKLERKDWDIEKIHDVSALRIIVSSIEEAYKTLGIIHGKWRPLPGRTKDYIIFPKLNGYQALHTTIFTGYGNLIEVQIKSQKMHKDAEYGKASHLLYKKNIKKKEVANFLLTKHLLSSKNFFKTQKETSSDNIPRWIKEFAEYQKTQNNKNNKNNKEDTLQKNFFEKRIFVFTPKEDVIDLPVDSSPIDFAYSIHSDIGNRMSGAKINGKLTSFDIGLENGDIIEIITKTNSNPTRKWLAIAKTPMAKKSIRAALQKIK